MKNQFIFGNNPVEEFIRERADQVLKVYLRDQLKGDRKQALKRIASEANVPVQQVPEIKLRKLVGNVNHQGVVAEISQIAYTDFDEFLSRVNPDEAPFILALDHITDPQNFGACLRSAAATSASAVIFPLNDQVGVTGTVIKTSAGTAGKVPLIRVEHLNQALARFRDLGFRVLALDAAGSASPWNSDLDDAIVFVIGSEGQGISDAVKKHCDQVLSYPLASDVESLNASVTAGLILFEAYRQRLERKS